MAKTISIDFDACIHKYSEGWKDGSIYDTQTDYIFQAIQELMHRGYSVFILSTRKPKQIKEWLEPRVLTSEYFQGAIGEDPFDYTIPKYGYTVEVIPWWRVLFSKSYFWNKKDVLGITNIKLAAHCYIDDRALKFEGDWIKTLEQVDSFKTYQENSSPITINGKMVHWRGDYMDYDELFAAAYPREKMIPNFSATCHYIDGRGKILQRGEKIKIENFMSFSIHNTSNA